MPTYALRCLKCKREWEEFASVTARDSIECCGTRAETNFQAQQTRRHWQDREFVGDSKLSHRYKFIPQQVREMRQKMGKHAGCIKDGGEVEFTSRREEQGFHKHFTEKVASIDP